MLQLRPRQASGDAVSKPRLRAWNPDPGRVAKAYARETARAAAALQATQASLRAALAEMASTPVDLDTPTPADGGSSAPVSDHPTPSAKPPAHLETSVPVPDINRIQLIFNPTTTHMLMAARMVAAAEAQSMEQVVLILDECSKQPEADILHVMLRLAEQLRAAVHLLDPDGATDQINRAVIELTEQRDRENFTGSGD